MDKVTQKGILEFDLEDPYARNAFTRANNATNAYIALHEIDQKLFRPITKWGTSDNSKIAKLLSLISESEDSDINLGIELVEELRAEFYELLETNNINLDDLE